MQIPSYCAKPLFIFPVNIIPYQYPIKHFHFADFINPLAESHDWAIAHTDYFIYVSAVFVGHFRASLTSLQNTTPRPGSESPGSPVQLK